MYILVAVHVSMSKWKGHWPVGMSPEEDHEDDRRAGVALL